MVPCVLVQPPTEQFSSGQPLAFQQQMVQDQSIDSRAHLEWGYVSHPGVGYTAAW